VSGIDVLIEEDSLFEKSFCKSFKKKILKAFKDDETKDLQELLKLVSEKEKKLLFELI